MPLRGGGDTGGRWGMPLIWWLMLLSRPFS